MSDKLRTRSFREQSIIEIEPPRANSEDESHAESALPSTGTAHARQSATDKPKRNIALWDLPSVKVLGVRQALDPKLNN